MTSFPVPPPMGVPVESTEVPLESTLGRRVAGRIIDGVLVAVQSALPYLAVVGLLVGQYGQYGAYSPSGGAAASTGQASVWIVVVSLLLLSTLGLSVWAFFARGVGPGAALLGLESVDPTTGRVALGHSFYKYLLQWLVSFLTLGIAEMIVSYVTYRSDDDRTWFDRTAGVVVRRRRPYDESSVPEPGPAPRTTPVISDIGLPGPSSRPTDSYIPDHQRPAPDAYNPASDAFQYPPPAASPPTATPVAFPQQHPDVHAPVAPLPQPDAPPQPAAPFNPYALRSAEEPAPETPATGAPSSAYPGAVPSPGASAIEHVGQTEVGGGYIASTPFSPGPTDQASAVPTPSGPSDSPIALPTPPPVLRERSSAPVPGTMPAESDITILAPDILATVGTGGPTRPARLLLSTGEAITLSRPLVIGRNPVAPADVPDAEPRIMDDPNRSLSKTHLVVGPADSGVWVIDLHSTNGVTVAQGSGDQPSRVAPGERITVPRGGRLHFGSYGIEVLT